MKIITCYPALNFDWQPKIINSNLSMKSKYLDINKFKEPFDPLQNEKNYRKPTKPKNTLKMYLPNSNETDSDFHP